MGVLYRDAVAEAFEGATIGGLRLLVSRSEGFRARVGEGLALTLRIHNDSDEELAVTTGGSCGTVHAAGFVVIDPDGRLWQGLGRGKVGGPHCFCNQTTEKLDARSSIRLDTRTVSDAVVPYLPLESGTHVVIGTYSLRDAGGPERFVRSRPIMVHVAAE